jgi:hypothetical protein
MRTIFHSDPERLMHQKRLTPGELSRYYEEAGHDLLRDPLEEIPPVVPWPAIVLTPQLAAYLLWLIARDLVRWRRTRKCRLRQDEAAALGRHLGDMLPEGMRTPLPTVRGRRRRSG